MKILIFTIFALSITFGYSQNNSLSGTISNGTTPTRNENTPEVLPTPTVANLTKEVVQTNFQYTFVSNKPFSEFKEEPWENRFVIAYPYLIEINITAANQTIVVILPENHTHEQLLKIVKHFNYIDYNILN